MPNNVDDAMPLNSESDITWREDNDDAWCDGHIGTEQVDDCVEVDENGHEV